MLLQEFEVVTMKPSDPCILLALCYFMSLSFSGLCIVLLWKDKIWRKNVWFNWYLRSHSYKYCTARSDKGIHTCWKKHLHVLLSLYLGWVTLFCKQMSWMIWGGDGHPGVPNIFVVCWLYLMLRFCTNWSQLIGALLRENPIFVGLSLECVRILPPLKCVIIGIVFLSIATFLVGHNLFGCVKWWPFLPNMVGSFRRMPCEL